MVESVELGVLIVVLEVVLEVVLGEVLEVVLEVVLEEVTRAVVDFSPGTHSPQIRGQNLSMNEGISSHMP